eukprot:COSAG01_NODE_441_length_17032_cov_27.546389_3_plen_52_part_00
MGEEGEAEQRDGCAAGLCGCAAVRLCAATLCDCATAPPRLTAREPCMALVA